MHSIMLTYAFVNLPSLVESCWMRNLRILHSPHTTGEWTRVEARFNVFIVGSPDQETLCLHVLTSVLIILMSF